MSEDHSADRTHLLALVPADGAAVGNTALIRQDLGWAENRYWYVRDSLLEAGVPRTGERPRRLGPPRPIRTKVPNRRSTLRRN